MITLFTSGSMTRLNLHKKGACIKVNASKHKGKTGTIHKVNPMKHSVLFDNGASGYVQPFYCVFLEKEPASIPWRHQDRRAPSKTSRLSSAALDLSPAPCPLTVSILELSDTDSVGFHPSNLVMGLRCLHRSL
jgi:hypothetical protein